MLEWLEAERFNGVQHYGALLLFGKWQEQAGLPVNSSYRAYCAWLNGDL